MTPEEARTLLKAERALAPLSKEERRIRARAKNTAASKARTALQRLHNDEYQVLFEAAFEIALKDLRS